MNATRRLSCRLVVSILGRTHRLKGVWPRPHLGQFSRWALLLVSMVVAARTASADIYVSFDSVDPGEALVSSVIDTTPGGSGINWSVAGNGFQSVGSVTTQNIAFFPTTVTDGSVNFVEPDPTISDTIEFHLVANGNFYSGLIRYETDTESGLAPIPGGTMISETGNWQYLNDPANTNDPNRPLDWGAPTGNFLFSDPLGNPIILPDLFLPPPNPTNAYGPLHIRARSDVPEPGTFALLATGLCGLGWLARKRRLT